MKVNLKWITPDTDKMIGHMARVSNPSASPDDPADRLIAYLLKHKHFSPFEMACVCVEIETTRDIARQILRHRSFHFQEFSQRYAEVDEEPDIGPFTRLQDPKNRQNSICVNDKAADLNWQDAQQDAWDVTHDIYKSLLTQGVAKELARKVLPEGLCRTKMYMQGTIRDWLHYIDVRQGPETQLEHQQVAFAVLRILEEACPAIMSAAQSAGITRPFSDVA